MNAQELKYRVEGGLLPLARTIRVSPNMITVSAFGVMVVAGGLLESGRLAGAGVFILLSGFLDILDGAVARATERATPFGALLDRVFDRAGDFTIIACAILGGYTDPRLGLFVLCTVLLASYISSCLEAVTCSNVGEKLSLRAVRLGVLALACFGGKIHEGMMLLAFVGSAAVFSRMVAAYRILSGGTKAVSD